MLIHWQFHIEQKEKNANNTMAGLEMFATNAVRSKLAIAICAHMGETLC